MKLYWLQGSVRSHRVVLNVKDALSRILGSKEGERWWELKNGNWKRVQVWETWQITPKYDKDFLLDCENRFYNFQIAFHKHDFISITSLSFQTFLSYWLCSTTLEACQYTKSLISCYISSILRNKSPEKNLHIFFKYHEKITKEM